MKTRNPPSPSRYKAAGGASPASLSCLPDERKRLRKMAKSTNHTAHNQSYKNHRNGAFAPRQTPQKRERNRGVSWRGWSGGITRGKKKRVLCGVMRVQRGGRRGLSVAGYRCTVSAGGGPAVTRAHTAVRAVARGAWVWDRGARNPKIITRGFLARGSSLSPPHYGSNEMCFHHHRTRSGDLPRRPRSSPPVQASRSPRSTSRPRSAG